MLLYLVFAQVTLEFSQAAYIWAGNSSAGSRFQDLQVLPHLLYWASNTLFLALLWITATLAWRHAATLDMQLVCLSLLLSLSILLALNVWTPTSSWDALNFWSNWADRLIHWHQDEPANPHFNRLHSRHPRTVVFSIASGGYLAKLYTSSLGAYLSWYKLFICMIANLLAMMVLLRFRGYLIIFCIALVGTLPIVENHVGLAGYADLWLLALGVLSMTSLIVALEISSVNFAVIGVIYALLCVSTKNTGILVCLLLLASYAKEAYPTAINIPEMFKRARALLVALPILLACAVALNFQFQCAAACDLAIGIGQRTFIISPADPLDALSALKTMLLVNSSFSISVPFILVGLYCFCGLTLKSKNDASVISVSTNFAMFLSLSVFLVYLLPLFLSSEYLLGYASSSSDLGGTRFLMLPITALIIASAICMERHLRIRQSG